MELTKSAQIQEAVRAATLLSSKSHSWRFSCIRLKFRISEFLLWSTGLPLLAQTPPPQPEYTTSEKLLSAGLSIVSGVLIFVFRLYTASQAERIKDLEASREADLKHAEATLHVSHSMDKMTETMEAMSAQLSRIVSAKLGK